MQPIKTQKFITQCMKDTRPFSLEITPTIDVELLKGVNFSSCAVVCLTSDVAILSKPKEIPAIMMCVKLIAQGYNVILHLPGRNLTRTMAMHILEYLRTIGLKNILALKGDESYINEVDDTKCDFPYAVDFVRFIKENFDRQFCVGVAGYPDKHPKSPSVEADLIRLKEKVDAGAEFIITQVVFKYETFQNFVKSCQKHGIKVPIIPGIFIITTYDMLLSLKKLCSISIPEDIHEDVRVLRDDQAAVRSYGINSTIELIKALTEDKQIKLIHIYIFNKIDLYLELLAGLEETHKNVVDVHINKANE